MEIKNLEKDILILFDEANRLGAEVNKAYIPHKSKKEITFEDLANYDVGLTYAGEKIVVKQYPED